MGPGARGPGAGVSPEEALDRVRAALQMALDEEATAEGGGNRGPRVPSEPWAIADALERRILLSVGAGDARDRIAALELRSERRVARAKATQARLAEALAEVERLRARTLAEHAAEVEAAAARAAELAEVYRQDRDRAETGAARDREALREATDELRVVRFARRRREP